MALLELLGIGANLLGGMMGSKAEKKAQEQNYKIAMENLAWQKEQFNRLFDEAAKERAEGKLGYTDAQGNRVYYVEGQGWVTDLSDQQEMMRDIYRKEEERQMAQDIPAKREQMFANIARQRGEGGYADALMEAMKQEKLGTSRDVVGMRNLASAEGINEGYDKTLEDALRNARATGSSNTGKIMADIGRSRGDELRKAFLENQRGAGSEAYNDYATRVGNLGQLYNMFATRSSAIPGAEYNPRNIEGSTASMLQGAAGAGGAANQNLLSAIGQGMNIQNKFQAQPMYGMANTVSQLGSQIGSLGGGGGYSNPFSSYAAAPSYNSGGSDKYKPGAGLW